MMHEATTRAVHQHHAHPNNLTSQHPNLKGGSDPELERAVMSVLLAGLDAKAANAHTRE